MGLLSHWEGGQLGSGTAVLSRGSRPVAEFPLKGWAQTPEGGKGTQEWGDNNIHKMRVQKKRAQAGSH